jgi:hypothetical protein
MEARLLHEDRGEREHDAVHVRHDEERDRIRRLEEAKGRSHERDHEADRFDDGAEQLGEEEVRQRNHARCAVLRIEHHLAMRDQGGDEPAMPTFALPSENLRRRRHLGPRHRVGDERDPGADVLLLEVPLQPHAYFEVLGHRARRVAEDLGEVVASEQTERAGDVEVAAEQVPTQSPEKKGAQVLDGLDTREPARIHARVGHTPVRHRARVDDADRTSHGRNLLVEEEGARQTQQGIRFDERVRITGEHIRKARRVQADIERVRLAPVLLVYHEQLRPRARAVVGTHALRAQPAHDGGGDFVQVVCVDQPLQRVVLGAVVHQHDFVVRVAQREQGTHALDDGHRFVVRRRDDAHARCSRRCEAADEDILAAEAVVREKLRHCQHKQDEEERVHDERVPEHGQIRAAHQRQQPLRCLPELEHD